MLFCQYSDWLLKNSTNQNAKNISIEQNLPQKSLWDWFMMPTYPLQLLQLSPYGDLFKEWFVQLFI